MAPAKINHTFKNRTFTSAERRDRNKRREDLDTYVV
jgi:hypothetical protein